jgi:hypothetical protein
MNAKQEKEWLDNMDSEVLRLELESALYQNRQLKRELYKVKKELKEYKEAVISFSTRHN